jgi:hypothetical protein
MQKVEKEQKEQTKAVSETHFLIIDCSPGQLRPNAILNMILTDDSPDFEEDDALMYDDSISEQDFSLIYSSFGEWKYGVYNFCCCGRMEWNSMGRWRRRDKSTRIFV